VLRDETLKTIRSHAGLGEAVNDGVSDAIARGVGVEEALRDFLAAMQRLNIELNGQVPSSTIGEDNALLPSALVYAVGEVARMLREARRDADAWAVDTAWLALLAGDIDDVAGHVAEERAARG